MEGDPIGAPQIAAGAVLLQRGVEELYARRNTRRLLAAGGREEGSAYYPVVAVTHLAWIASIFFLVPATAAIFWPAAALFHPYIHEAGERGPFVDVNARAQFTGLSTRTSFLDLVRAVYEGLAFAARDCYAAMGPLPKDLRLTGGGARSKALRRFFASALDAPVRSVEREEAGAAGAAMIAAVQQKVFPSMVDCATKWVDPVLGPETKPDAGLTQHFNALFPIYRETRDQMRGAWRALQTARQGAYA